MPRRPQERHTGSEKELAATIAALRKQKGWSNEQLAERMTAVGCKMHATGIYKTENEGRRITLDEALAYAEVFGASSLDDLLTWGRARLQTEAYWREFQAAIRMCTTLVAARISYHDTVRAVAFQVNRNSTLREQIEAELARKEAWQLEEFKSWHDPRSTTDEGRRAMLEEYPNSNVTTCRDVLSTADELKEKQA